MRFQPFQPIGLAHGQVQFHTDSWSGEQNEGYEVTFDLHKRTVDCSCLDATCRKKNFRPVGSPHLCKHGRLASELLWPVIAQALGVAS